MRHRGKENFDASGLPEVIEEYVSHSFDDGKGRSVSMASSVTSDFSDNGAVYESDTSTFSEEFHKRDMGNDVRLGVTLDGLRVFTIPESGSHFDALFTRCYALPSLFAWFGIFSSFFVAWRYAKYPWVMVLVAVFWRLCYNLGVGVLLKRQSSDFAITLFVDRMRQRPFSSTNRCLDIALSGTMVGGRSVLNDHTLPSSYPAWILFRSIVNLVESNDVVAFTLMAYQFGYEERQVPLLSFPNKLIYRVADLVGLLLICLSLYSKMAARRTAGDYGWYWGDFFFLRTGNFILSFDGVFELFPHPMYTVGYGWTYGCAILARSFTVLACAMAFHFSQMLFLIFVEAPHVERLYGNNESVPNVADKLAKKLSPHGKVCTSGFDRPPHEEFTRTSVFVVKNFDIYRASDVNLLLTLLFFVLSVWLGSFKGGPLDDDVFFVGLALGLHIVSALVKSVVLVRQEKTKFWTRHFTKQGLSKQDAFDSWKRLYNLLQSLQHIGFILCSIRLFSVPGSIDGFLHAEYISQMFLGLMLVVISVWSFSSCYEVLGDYGWFYGDFFIPPPSNTENKPGKDRSFTSEEARKAHKRQKRHASLPSSILQSNSMEEERMKLLLSPKVSGDRSSVSSRDFTPPDQPSYKGIYRYLNNPDVYLGHLWMYGFAFIAASFELFAVALLSHAMKIAFLQAVEKPHFRSVYKHHVRKHSTALGKALNGKVSDIKRNETALFLANWVKHPIETGALAPSSQQLAVAMCDTMHLGNNAVVVELGPGTGPFTKEILKRLGGATGTTYLGFELNADFIDRLVTRFPDNKANFLCESAENIIQELNRRGLEHADTVISGLPWAIFSEKLQRDIMTEVHNSLKPGGRFCTFAYLQGLVLPAGQSFKSLLDETFSKVERSPIIWRNMPPAFVYRCQK
eukprot:CAMPEP_0203746928 /NCGR_PEP_ID=MMETSP0098-20131031/2212_1 /ASSEMBLY_ACC=CAM_ASM_000208 /TAXON_ID=96639 /ORGANISM=" , Strain NY0313808BC1" /LENGTH=908 /DNA_ID=CAMNT_0050635181 /DNA_START=157 /DNA_END=2883 /DNA_ORIENTATION=-